MRAGGAAIGPIYTKLLTSVIGAESAGRRADLTGGAAIKASILSQVPSAHHRLYQRQHVVEAA